MTILGVDSRGREGRSGEGPSLSLGPSLPLWTVASADAEGSPIHRSAGTAAGKGCGVGEASASSDQGPHCSVLSGLSLGPLYSHPSLSPPPSKPFFRLLHS